MPWYTEELPSFPEAALGSPIAPSLPLVGPLLAPLPPLPFAPDEHDMTAIYYKYRIQWTLCALPGTGNTLLRIATSARARRVTRGVRRLGAWKKRAAITVQVWYRARRKEIAVGRVRE